MPYFSINIRLSFDFSMGVSTALPLPFCCSTSICISSTAICICLVGWLVGLKMDFDMVGRFKTGGGVVSGVCWSEF
jgi:hypothetical protein